jgi:hypothetical protein
MKIDTLIEIHNSKFDAAAKRLHATISAAKGKERSKARREVLAKLDARIDALIGRYNGFNS